MVSTSQQMIHLIGQRRRSPVLPQRGKVRRHLAIKQRQLLQFSTGEAFQPAAISCRDKGGQPLPVRGAFLNPKVGEDGLH